MANQAYRNFMVHEPALADEIVYGVKAIALVGHVFRRPGIDNEIERAPQILRNLSCIEIQRDAVAMAFVVQRCQFKSERVPEGPRWRCLSGEILGATRTPEVDAPSAE